MKLDVAKSTEVQRNVSDAYRFIATDHGRNHPRWDAWATEFRQIDPGPIAVGTRFAYRRRAFGPISQRLQLVVTEMLPDRRFAFRLSGSTKAAVTYTLEQLGAAATRVDFAGRFEVPGPQFLGGVMKGGLDRQVSDGQRRIKELLESGS